MATLLQSPNFLYRVELGEADPAGGPGLRLTGFELATRLAYLIWNAPPDDALLDAAAQGRLHEDAGLTAELGRLAAHAKGKAGLGNFFEDWLELEGLGLLDKDKTALPLFTATIGPAMRTEIGMTLADLGLARKADLRELFVNRSTFVNAELAKLYGVTAPAGTAFQRVSWPADGPRAGVLGFAGLLSLHAKPRKTFPTGRGVFVRQSLLCQNIPPPPPNVSTNLAAPKAGEKLTLRQQLERHREDPVCDACHKLLDPPGLALENFDALGVYRTTDNGLPIDASGTLDGTAFTDAAGLGAALAAHPDSMKCVVRQLFRYAVGHLETDGELAAVQALDGKLEASGRKLPALLEALVLSPAFRRVSKP